MHLNLARLIVSGQKGCCLDRYPCRWALENRAVKSFGREDLAKKSEVLMLRGGDVKEREGRCRRAEMALWVVRCVEGLSYDDSHTRLGEFQA